MPAGRPSKPDTCNICGIPIVRTKRQRERLCNEHLTARVMISKRSKRNTADILDHIQSMNKTIGLLVNIVSWRESIDG